MNVRTIVGGIVRLRDRLCLSAMVVITGVCLLCTIFFAYNSSVEQPFLPALVAKTPQRTILVLNVISQISLFCLAEMTRLVMDAVRYSLACSATGTSALSFLALSQATHFLGALCLACAPCGKGVRSGHRVWSAQRCAF